MYRKEVNEISPLRILERSIHGGLGPGNLGVVMARAGVGKTAVLIQIGLDEAMRDRDVLHLALGQQLEHVQAWYDALFDDLARQTGLADRDTVRAIVNRHRVIHATGDAALTPERLEKTIDLYTKHAGFTPGVILVDGYSWAGPIAQRAAELGAFKAAARRLGAELWMVATHGEATQPEGAALAPPCAAFIELIDVALFLEPERDHVTIRLLKDHGHDQVSSMHLNLDCDTMRLRGEHGEREPLPLPAEAFTLLSGGAPGAESEFGAAAERWGVGEITFSFAGRTPARAHSVVQLDDAQLELGRVSMTYVESHLHRSFPRTPAFQKVLQSIWHQVATAGEVFVVGVMQPDKTIKGGTGWAAELARHFGKGLFVYDQERRSWFAWQNGEWQETPAPRITRTRFAGTGTRFLTDEGRAAIAQLFTASFGPPRAPRA
ncbi:MAG TPA: hypothetical protein VGQ83_08420 [Polyangia bacterium]|jgi:hypothetical protein